ncbi:MAG: type-F conjugative transfer system protein TraW [Alphaproteobacteria bacterium]|nr:type-F conjugative transfer system protein TraW [Alphaproteobacteria bacterium]
MLQKAVLRYCRIKRLWGEDQHFKQKLTFAICNTAILVSAFSAQARDFGTHGVIYPIEEEDPIALIQSKLKRMEERGELENHYQELQQKTKAGIERPKPVEGITKACENRVFYFDPTYEVPEDIKDHMGQVFYKKGTKINPLETITISQNLLFFDGDDDGQVAFAREKLKENSVKLILVKGAPLALSEKIKVPVYFDQGGLLTKKLGIHHVPAFVTQEELRLRIEEIDLKAQTNSPSELKKDSLSKSSRTEGLSNKGMIK